MKFDFFLFSRYLSRDIRQIVPIFLGIDGLGFYLRLVYYLRQTNGSFVLNLIMGMYCF